MKNLYYRIKAWLLGHNSQNTPPEVIKDQLNESRPLPIGLTEFEEWSDRIISGALVKADSTSQKFTLAGMLLHLSPTESFKPDAFFVHSLRKQAVNETAVGFMQKVKDDQRAAALAKEAAKQANLQDGAEIKTLNEELKTEV